MMNYKTNKSLHYWFDVLVILLSIVCQLNS